MERAKRFIVSKFEIITVSTILLGLFITHLFVPYKLGFLNLFYLPALAAGYAMGRKEGVLAAVASILFVVLTIILFPKQYMANVNTPLTLTMNLLPWGGFLILAGYTVGYLTEIKNRQYEALRKAYIGTLEILTKLLESVDRYTEAHSVRVANIAMDIALAMGLDDQEVENIRVAGLLHDIGKFEITTDLLKKAADLTQEERAVMMTHTEKGAQILVKMGDLLKDAVPLILAHHEFYIEGAKRKKGKKIPLGARIIAVADAYDAIVSDRPYRKGRPPWVALEEIRKGAGSQFDPKVVEAFEKVVAKYITEEK